MTQFVLNRQNQSYDGDPEMPLLWYLRDTVGLTGTKFGCGVGSCGACTVHVNGEPVRSCQTMMSDLEGVDLATIEGVDGQIATAVRRAWTELNVVQCGYCQSGQIMQAIGLLATIPKPDAASIDEQMGGNICRCAT